MTADWTPRSDWESVALDEVASVEEVYGQLRGRCPVARVTDDGGFWTVFGHEDVVRVAADPATFSNVAPMFTVRRPPLESDPPEHTVFRRILAPYFSSGRTARMEPVVRRDVVEMLDPLISTTGDFARDFTQPLPSRALCHLLGVPDRDWRTINDWSDQLHRAGAQRRDAPQERTALAEPIREYARKLAAERRTRPRDDVVSGLVTAEMDGHPLEEELVAGIVMMLIGAGHNTTTSMLGSAVVRLARDQALQRHLRDTPARIPAFLEEVLRMDAPQQAMPRRATRDVTIGDREVRAGEFVWPVFGAANLDPAAFSEPCEFNPDRTPNRHVAFGRGLHRCIGAPLAQLQGRVVLEELLARTATFTLAGPVRRPAWPRMGVTALPLHLTAAER